jgi:hypothetical protein
MLASSGHGQQEESVHYHDAQEVRDENFNRSIRNVVSFRHVPLSSHGESGVHKLHNFTNPEQAISSAGSAAACKHH